MYLNNISLINFRNIKELNLSFNKSIIIFYGDNGQGKTNIVESIYALANATSFRTSYFKEMINNTSDEAIVIGKVIKGKGEYTYRIVLNKSGKTAYINDVLVNKISEYIGNLNVVCFSPEDVYLFKDSPGIRRNFLNKELSMLFPIYIKQLIAFKDILEERNNLLKKKIDYNLLDVINEKIVESSYIIYIRRKWLIEKIEEFATNIYFNVSNENKRIKIIYNSFINELDKEAYLNKALKLYNDTINKDIERQYTINGIHKDDFKVYLDDMLIDLYASQGQQRLISLCIKLAVGEIVNKANKSEPIIILDDAFSELDLIKKERVFKYLLTKEQVFITCTNYQEIISTNIPLNTKVIKIKEGLVEERSSN